MPDLLHKVALITGAGSGIGAGTAKHFAKLGCWLALNDLRPELLDETARECVQLGLPEDRLLCLPGDIASAGVPELLVSKTVDFFGKLDVLLNIAGFVQFKDLVDTTESEIDAMMNVNFKAMFRLIQLSAPHLKESKGSIVNVSSVNAVKPSPKISVYNISKGAVDQLTRCSAIELAPEVRVNGVAPGAVKTQALVHAGMSQEMNDFVFGPSFSKRSLLGRVGTPEDIAKAIAFLASDDASFITGTTMVVDGGYLLHMAQILE